MKASIPDSDSGNFSDDFFVRSGKALIVNQKTMRSVENGMLHKLLSRHIYTGEGFIY